MQFKEKDVEWIVKQNISKVKGGSYGSVLMPDDIIKIMTKSIYDSIIKYHESLKTGPR